jgi:hypothetical protein
MRSERIPDADPGDPDSLKQALLGLLVCDHTGLWTLAELDRCLSPSSNTEAGCEPDRVDVEDAVEDLYAAGLVHRFGVYVFATRAAHAAQRLAE